MTPAEIALAERLGRLINGVIRHRVGQVLGEISAGAQPNNPEVRQLNTILQNLATAEIDSQCAAVKSGRAGGAR